MASGDVVNTAARLQSAAPVNGILVDETTYRATDQKIDYSESEPVTAKGKQEPVAGMGGDRRPLELRRRRRPGAARSADRARARGRRARGRAGTCACGAIAAARHPRRRSRDRQEPSRLRALPGDRERGRADQLASGPLTPLRRRRLLLGAGRDGQGASGDPRDRLVGGDGEQARSERPGARRPVGGGMGRAAPRHADRARERTGPARRSPRRGLRRLAAVLRGDRRPTAARPRLRGPALGGRRAPRLRRPPRRLGWRRADPRRLHGSPGAAVQAGGLGRRKAERADALALAARRRPDRAPPRCPARAVGAPGRKRRPRCSSGQAATRCTRRSSCGW